MSFESQNVVLHSGSQPLEVGDSQNKMKFIFATQDESRLNDSRTAC